MPAIPLDVALVHMHRADKHGNGQCLGPDLYFDDLYCMAAKRSYMSCEQLLDTHELTREGPVQSLRISRMWISGVVHAPFGAHFTECPPDYGRDEAFQQLYAAAAKDPAALARFVDRYVRPVSASAYREAVLSR